jgi:hypothetical protein
MRTLLNFLFEAEHIYFEILQYPGPDTFPLSYETKKQMLCPDIVMTQPESLLPAEADYILDSI